MRIVFMGTPDFSVPTLEQLIRNHQVVGVVTQPDKRKGRGKAMAFPPVKEKALEYDIPVYQPVKVREPEFIEELKKMNPDIIVVVAFGQILPEEILNLPPYGCVNVHASLLPKYRGAAPIQWAVIDGEKETGVTTMYMAKGLDTGDMLDKVVVPIDPKETGESLHDKLSEAGGRLILETLTKLENGTAVRIPQNDAESCYAKMLTKELGEIDWNQSAAAIERLIRGLNSWPSAYTHLDGKTLKIWDADVEEGQADVAVGTVTEVKKDCFYVQTGDGRLKINEIQLQGKKRMAVQAFLLGYKIEKGTVLHG
ncbi:MAG: methionyl-tRNA formyltransferase [Anaerobutyricum sp.]|nr:methionyl-tRNA formyltransferase [Eubacterium sp.]MDY6046711.1 methionyl-tRNA formyltransferase [Anaerobutyricum sp.]